MKPIGVDIPITRGEQGLFKQTYTTFDSIKSNLKNLLMTKNGERPLNPEFGNGLSGILFESDTEVTSESIKQTIRDIVAAYEPSVIIQSISANINDKNSIEVYIEFSIASYPTFIDRLNLNLSR